MALTSKQLDFIQAIAGYVQKYAPEYGIQVCSPIIAQAILESAWGESRLAAQYHNYFGMKCGTLWKGPSVNMSTQEEYQAGTLTTIKDNFRAYSSMEEGVKGYFEFIQLSRYKNLKGITDPKKYLETIKEDGYATSSTYVADVYKCVTTYNLTKYDNKSAGGAGAMAGKVTAQDVLNVMRSWLGFSEANGKFKQIIDLYNSHKPLARGYAVKYTDEWCDTCVSAAAIKAGAVDLIGTECGCEEHVKIFKAKGIWIEDGTIMPEPGDIILFNWDDNTQPNDGYSDHIGYVESVSGKTITTIEGNKGQAVARRTISVGHGNIRGYARPKYAAGSGANNSSNASAGVVAGNTGSSGTGTLNKEPKWVGEITRNGTPVRTWAGATTSIQSWPSLNMANLVDVCDTVKDSNGHAWYYVRIAGKYYGFVDSSYIKMAGSGSNVAAAKSIEEVAKEVIAGKWGNGADRKKRLEAAGYSYSQIQAKVNELI